jgi:SHS2 domain-containing protein
MNTPRAVKPSHRFVEHVGEVELELEAASEAGIFEAALAALAELLAGGEGGEPVRRELDLTAADRALLLVDWLDELVFLAEVEGFVPARVVALQITDARLRATVEGRRGDARHLVTAATLERLELRRAGARWHARVVLDV